MEWGGCSGGVCKSPEGLVGLEVQIARGRWVMSTKLGKCRRHGGHQEQEAVRIRQRLDWIGPISSLIIPTAQP